MYAKSILISLAIATASFSGVAAHGKVAAATGTNGIKAQGFAIVDGTCPGPQVKCEGDTTVFARGKKRGPFGLFGRATSSGCGKTKNGGVTDCAAALAAMESSTGVPSCGADGTVTLDVHQVNQDGAGPYKMMVNTDGTGATWTNMAVSQNVPGTFGLSAAAADDFQLVGQMPAGTKCTGGADGQTCLVRAQNPIGPFGGVMAITQNEGGATPAAAGNATRRAFPAPVVNKGIAGRALVVSPEAEKKKRDSEDVEVRDIEADEE